MVFLVVKGTVYPDEFTAERRLSDALSTSAPAQTSNVAAASPGAPSASESSIVPVIAHLLNMRHQLRLVLMSASELASLAAPKNGDKAEEDKAALLLRYAARIEELQARLKDTKSPVQDGEFDTALAEMRTMTSLLYPTLCTHPDGVPAAIDRLYSQHEDPDLDEDTRLLVYHCRAILDPQWKANERVAEDTAALWFCGKAMEGTLAAYAGRNEKSKIIVKVAPRAGPAPSGEPRMRYEDQRALYQAVCQRRETYKQLETSELRDRVVQQARGVVHLPTVGGGGAAAAAGSGGAPTLRTERLRPIYARKEERELPIS